MAGSDPYLVLGVARSTPIEEVEATYRLILRAHHPDLHQADGPDAVIAAELRTRQITEAMHRIREEHRRSQWSDQRWAQQRRDSARHQPPRHHAPIADEPVPCPYCDDTFSRLKDFSNHLASVHPPLLEWQRRRGGATTAPGPSRGVLHQIGKARFIPLWIPLGLFWLFFFGSFHTTWLWGSALLLVLVVLWTSTSTTFKRHR